jgi:peptide/nickel transport system substrate-binding protein
MVPLLMAVAIGSIGLGVSGASASVAGKAAPKPDRQGSFHFGTSTPPIQFDPHKGTNVAIDNLYMSPLYDSLITIDSNNKIVPMLATKWTAAADGSTLDMTLRSGVKFQDGVPFNAPAVLANFNYEKSLSGSTAQKNAAHVTAITAVDDLTVRFTFNDASAAFFPLIVAGAPDTTGAMVSPTALQNPSQLAATAVGSGPYTLVSRNATGAVYKRSTTPYWDKTQDAQLPENVTITAIPDQNTLIAAYESGQVDAMLRTDPIDNKQFAATHKGTKIVIPKAPAVTNISMRLNTASSKLADPRVREALGYGIDRVAIVNALFPNSGAVPNNQIYPTNSIYFDKTAPSVAKAYNPTKAKQLLAAAGMTNRLTLSGLSLDLKSYNDANLAIQAQLAKIGVTVNLTTVVSSQYVTAFQKGTYDFATASAIGAFDPSVMINNYFTGPLIPGGGDLAVATMAADAAKLPLGSAARTKAYVAIGKYLQTSPETVKIADVPSTYFVKSYVYGYEQQRLYGGNGDFRTVFVTKH